jgi:hypothetical protein
VAPYLARVSTVKTIGGRVAVYKEHRWKVGELEFNIHPHMDYPGEWFVTCRDLGISRFRLLGTRTPGEARNEAMVMLKERANRFAGWLGRAPLEAM